jgi:myo-inositol 2-dehydrogenase/D-chiro-inositol 1-dehydrogenase
MRTDHGLRIVRLGLVGAGRIGTMHAGNVARRVPGAELVGVADPREDAASELAGKYGARACGVDEMLADPEVDGVLVTSIAAVQSELIVRAAEAGKAVWCEKPASLTVEEIDRAIAATKDAGVPFQVGFNRRFAADFQAAKATVDAGGIGTPQLMRSITRDPGRPAGMANAGGVRPWTIFRETLIHDFDTLLWLNPGAEVVEVYTRADALVAPQFKADGLIDTAVVVLTFDNGAIATAEANFSALYGYDVRGEVFGSKGMVVAGRLPSTTAVHYDASGLHQQTMRSDEQMFRDAYVQELIDFTEVVRGNAEPPVTGEDARRALTIALAAMRSYEEHRPVQINGNDRLTKADI